VIDFDVLQILWAQVLDDFAELLEENLFKVGKGSGGANPVSPESIVANGLVKNAQGLVHGGALGVVDQLQNFAKHGRGPLLFCLLEVVMGPVELAKFVSIVHNDGDVQAGDGLEGWHGRDAQGAAATRGGRSPICAFERI